MPEAVLKPCSRTAAVRPGWRRVGAAACLACLLTASIAAQAADPLYKVEIDAPASLTGLLRDNLDIVRWSTRADAESLPLQQLYRTAPDQIKALLETQGFFDAKVEASLDEQATPPVARFKVTPGEPVKVGGLDLRFSGALTQDPDQEERIKRARATWTLTPGTVFRQEEWDRTKREIAANIAAFRYPTARVGQSQARIDTEARSADLEAEIDSGPLITLGEIEIAGLNRYPRSIIGNLNPIKPDAEFDQQLLTDFQRRLAGSGYFSTALVTAATDRIENNRVPVRVNVTEAPSQRVELGGGFSTDRGPRGFVRYTDNNLREAGWRWSSAIELDRYSSRLTSRVDLPPAKDGYRYAFGGRLETEDIQGQKTQRAGLTGSHLKTEERNETSTSLSYEMERFYTSGVLQDDRQATVLSRSWLINRTDNIGAPRSGYFVTGDIGAAVHPLLTTRSFVRATGKIVYLYSPTARDTIQLRAQAGVVAAQSRQGIPSVFLFRTGGDNTVRGYGYQSLGVEENGAIVGGRYLAVGSVEYTRWLSREWGAAVFYDAGNAVDDRSKFKAVHGYGAGVRWASPFGRLALDIAYGQAVHKLRLHFSVGISFK